MDANDEPVTYARLRELASDLAAVEEQARAVSDPGGTFFCANNAWFSIKRALSAVLGVWRKPVPGESREDAALLGRASSFEVAFLELNDLLPPCRDCGCVLFEPHRQADLAEREARRAGRAAE